MDWLIGEQLWKSLSAWGKQFLGLSPTVLANLLNTLLVLILYLLFTRLLKRALLRSIEDVGRRYRLTKTVSYAAGLLASLAIAKIWLAGAVNLSTYLGILSAGLAIALRDPITNIAGWLFIVSRQPFKVGDRIELGGDMGDVVDIRMFSFAMMEVGKNVGAEQSTGRMIHVPNGRIFNMPCTNATEGFGYVWNEIPVTVTFESDWERAHEILTDVVGRQAIDVEQAKRQVEKMGGEYSVYYTYLTPIVWLEVVDIGVMLTMRYLSLVRRRRATADRIWREVLKAFAAEPTIDFAYPTQRFYNNKLEGKPGAGGPPAGPAGPASGGSAE